MNTENESARPEAEVSHQMIAAGVSALDRELALGEPPICCPFSDSVVAEVYRAMAAAAHAERQHLEATRRCRGAPNDNVSGASQFFPSLRSFD